jgi:hypothetical protein
MDAKRQYADAVDRFVERGREVGRVVWTVKQGEEPSHDLYCA